MRSIAGYCCKICLIIFAVTLASCGEKEPDPIQSGMLLDRNLVVNPSFEEWEGRYPTGWERKVFESVGNKKPIRIERSTKEKKTGEASVYFRGLFDTDKWYVLTQRFPVAPGIRVEFSAEIKTKGTKKNQGQKDRANVYIQFLDENGERVNDRYYADANTHQRLGTTGWKRDKERIEAPKKARFVEIGLINQMTGRIYFDDVELKLSKGTEWVKKKSKYVHYNYIKGYAPPEGSIEKQIEMMSDYAKRLDLEVEKPFNYFYYSSEARFRIATGLSKYRQRAIWKTREIHTIEPVESLESAHMLLVDYGRPPLGLTTGIVYTLLGSLEGKDIHSTAKGFLVQKKIPALYRTISPEEFKIFDTSVTVPAWSSFCSFMLDRYGAEMLMRLYSRTDRVTESNVFNARFKEVYEKNFDIIDRQWRLYLLRLKTSEEGDTLQ